MLVLGPRYPEVRRLRLGAVKLRVRLGEVLLRGETVVVEGPDEVKARLVVGQRGVEDAPLLVHGPEREIRLRKRAPRP